MRILIIIFLFILTNNVNAKVYKITLKNNNWIKEIPRVYIETPFASRDWYCGAVTNIDSTWHNEQYSWNLMGPFTKVKLNKENKIKHRSKFDLFLRKNFNPTSYDKINCMNYSKDILETWFDHKNKTMGLFKLIQHDGRCMIYQTLIQKKNNLRTRISLACKNAYYDGIHYENRVIGSYFKVDTDNYKAFNQ